MEHAALFSVSLFGGYASAAGTSNRAKGINRKVKLFVTPANTENPLYPREAVWDIILALLGGWNIFNQASVHIFTKGKRKTVLLNYIVVNVDRHCCIFTLFSYRNFFSLICVKDTARNISDHLFPCLKSQYFDPLCLISHQFPTNKHYADLQ